MRRKGEITAKQRERMFPYWVEFVRQEGRINDPERDYQHDARRLDAMGGAEGLLIHVTGDKEARCMNFFDKWPS